MKNVIFTLAFVLIGTFAFANSAKTLKSSDNDFKGEVVITENCQNESSVIKITFNSKTEFNNFDMTELSTLYDGDCEVHVEVSVGVGKTYVKASITMKNVDCDEVVKKTAEMGENLKKQLG